MEDLGSYGAAPASVLNSRTRRFLARWLDPSTAAVNSEEYPQFWEGLAELMEFDYQVRKHTVMQYFWLWKRLWGPSHKESYNLDHLNFILFALEKLRFFMGWAPDS